MYLGRGEKLKGPVQPTLNGGGGEGGGSMTERGTRKRFTEKPKKGKSSLTLLLFFHIFIICFNHKTKIVSLMGI